MVGLHDPEGFSNLNSTTTEESPKFPPVRFQFGLFPQGFPPKRIPAALTLPAAVSAFVSAPRRSKTDVLCRPGQDFLGRKHNFENFRGESGRGWGGTASARENTAEIPLNKCSKSAFCSSWCLFSLFYFINMFFRDIKANFMGHSTLMCL